MNERGIPKEKDLKDFKQVKKRQFSGSKNKKKHL